MVYVGYSKNPLREAAYMGRDTADAAGARRYLLEFYNVVIVQEGTKQTAMEKCQNISSIVRTAYQRNLRMLDPDTLTDPLCAYNDVLMTPYTIRTTTPNVAAINAVVRPHVYFSIRD